MISEYAKALQGKQIKCILDMDMDPADPMIKMLADRAASRVTTACGVLTGKAMSGVDGARGIYWCYTWDVSGDADEPSIFMMSHEKTNYDEWKSMFAQAQRAHTAELAQQPLPPQNP